MAQKRCTKCESSRYSRSPSGLCRPCELIERGGLRRRLPRGPVAPRDAPSHEDDESKEPPSPLPLDPIPASQRQEDQPNPEPATPPPLGALQTIRAGGWLISLRVESVTWIGEGVPEPKPSRPGLRWVRFEEAFQILRANGITMQRRTLEKYLSDPEWGLPGYRTDNEWRIPVANLRRYMKDGCSPEQRREIDRLLPPGYGHKYVPPKETL